MRANIQNWLWAMSVLILGGLILIIGKDDTRSHADESSLFPSQFVGMLSPAEELSVHCASDPVYLGPGQSAHLKWAVRGAKSRVPLSLELESDSEDTFDLGELTQDSAAEATYRAPSKITRPMSLDIVASVVGSSIAPAFCPVHLVTRREPALPR